MINTQRRNNNKKNHMCDILLLNINKKHISYRNNKYVKHAIKPRKLFYPIIRASSIGWLIENC